MIIFPRRCTGSRGPFKEIPPLPRCSVRFPRKIRIKLFRIRRKRWREESLKSMNLAVMEILRIRIMRTRLARLSPGKRLRTRLTGFSRLMRILFLGTLETSKARACFLQNLIIRISGKFFSGLGR